MVPRKMPVGANSRCTETRCLGAAVQWRGTAAVSTSFPRNTSLFQWRRHPPHRPHLWRHSTNTKTPGAVRVHVPALIVRSKLHENRNENAGEQTHGRAQIVVLLPRSQRDRVRLDPFAEHRHTPTPDAAKRKNHGPQSSLRSLCAPFCRWSLAASIDNT